MKDQHANKPQPFYVMALMILCGVTTASAETGFDPPYERDYNIFNLATQYQPDNPLNPAQTYAPDNPFNPATRYDPGNPLNPANQHNPGVPFEPLNRSR